MLIYCHWHVSGRFWPFVVNKIYNGRERGFSSPDPLFFHYTLCHCIRDKSLNLIFVLLSCGTQLLYLLPVLDYRHVPFKSLLSISVILYVESTQHFRFVRFIWVNSFFFSHSHFDSLSSSFSHLHHPSIARIFVFALT